MKVTREDTAQREVSLNIELESADIEPYLERSYRRLVTKAQIPGFRPGKAPRYIVETFLGKEAMVRDSLDLILQESLDKAIEQESLEILGEPDLELLEIDPFSFKAVVSLEPLVDLGDFRSLRLEPEPVEVTEEQVDEVLERMRYSAAPWEPVDRPVKFGDLVTLDVDGVIEGEVAADDKGVDFIPMLDNPHPFPGFSVYLEGMKRDESKEFTLKVPEDYSDTTIAGKDCHFHAKVLEIKEKLLPDLDDEFAKGVGAGHESLEVLRASVLEDLTNHVESAAQRAFQDRSLEEVIKGASVEASDLMTNREIDHLLEERAQAVQGRRVDMDSYLQDAGKTPDELRDELRPVARERLTRVFVIRSLAREEGIEVVPEDIESELDSIVTSTGESNDDLRRALSTDSAMSSIGSAILQRRVLERLSQIVQGTAEDMDSSGAEGEDVAEGSPDVEGSSDAKPALAAAQSSGADESEEEGERSDGHEPT